LLLEILHEISNQVISRCGPPGRLYCIIEGLEKSPSGDV